MLTVRLRFAKRKVATETNLYKRYGEILFQKVASGYLLHFVQDGSSKNALETPRLRKNIKNQKIGEKIPINPPLTPIALRRGLCIPMYPDVFTHVQIYFPNYPQHIECNHIPKCPEY